MRSDAVPDLFSLARMAQSPHEDLRPLLLRIQTRTFVSTPGRDRVAARDFEEIALGLIPLVTDDVLAETAALLRTIEDAPAAVLSALALRLDHPGPMAARPGGDRPEMLRPASRADLAPPEIDRAVSSTEDRADLARAENRELRLDGHALASLVDRARSRKPLAQALLRRAELSVADRATLYAFAESGVRAQIRSDVACHVARLAPSRLPDRTGRADRIRSLAPGQRPGWLAPFLAAELGLGPRWRLDPEDEAHREMLVFALRALDLPAEDCIAILLGLDWREAKSVAIIFALAAIARSTTPEMATYLLGDEERGTRPATEPRRVEARELDRHRRSASAAAGRHEGKPSLLSAALPARASGPIARAGHR